VFKTPTFPNKAPKQYVLFPDGTQIFVNSISSLQVLLTAPTMVNVGLGSALNTYHYTAQSAASAQNILAQINDLMNGAISVPVLSITDPPPPGTSNFTCVTPNTTAVAAVYNGIIAGIGLLSLNITNIMADDGAGHIFQFDPAFGTTDTTINLFLDSTPGYEAFQPAGIYALSYSSDYGATWVAMGLSITST